MQTDPFRILRRSWELVRKNRFLWPLAFLIALAGGGSMGYNIWFQGPIPTSITGYSPLHRIGSEISDIAASNWAYTVSLLVVSILFGIAVLAVGVFAQASAVGGIAELESGRICGIRRSMGWGRQSFLRFFGLVFLYLVLVAAVSVPSIIYWRFWSGSKGLVLPCVGGIILGLGFVFVSVLAGLIVELSARFIVLEGSGIIDSIREGIDLFRQYWKETLAAWATVLVLTALGIIAMSILVGALSGPLTSLFTKAYREHSVILVFASTVAFIGAWAAAAALAAVFAIMGSSVWTVTFLIVEPLALPAGQSR